MRQCAARCAGLLPALSSAIAAVAAPVGFGALDFAARLKLRGDRWWRKELLGWDLREARAVRML